MEGDLDKKIDSWKQKLLDLTKRNKMINFRETKSKSLPLHGTTPGELSSLLFDGENLFVYRPDPEPDEKEKSDEDIDEGGEQQDQEESENEWQYLDKNEVGSTRERDTIETSLYRLFLKQKEKMREKGVDTLYISLGMLNWYEAEHSDEQLKSPLVFIPVSLERETNSDPNRYDYKLRYEEEEVLINPALRKKLLDERNIEIPDDDEADLEHIEEVFNAIEEAIAGFSRWEITDETILGIYDFTKYALYRDLEENREDIKEDDIVRALTGDTDALPDELPDVPTADQLDEEVSPQDTFQVLDADSSQQEAIEAAKAGIDFVLQGPPGTGKSQTIANIIAEKLAQGETVLFVSEKMAALDVVKKRLDDVGVGRFCLEVHGRKANKNKVLNQIGKELRSDPVKNVDDREEKLRELKDRREQLNAYGKLLFQHPGEIGQTPYDVQGKLAKLHNVPRISVDIDAPLSVADSEFSTVLSELEGLQDFPYEINNFDSHPWRHTTLNTWEIDTREKLEESLQAQMDEVPNIHSWAERAEEKLDIQIDSVNDFRQTIKLLDHILHRPDIELSPALFENGFHESPDRLEALADLVSEWREHEEHLDQRYRQSIYSQDGTKLLEELSEYGATRYVRLSYRKLKKRILSHGEDDYSADYADLKDDLRHLQRFQEIEEEIDEFAELIDKLGHLYDGRNTDWEAVTEIAEWMDEYYNFERFEKETLREAILSDDEETISSLLQDGGDLEEDWDTAAQFFEEIVDIEQATIDGEPFYTVDFDTLTEHLSFLQDEIARLKDWIQFQTRLDEMDNELAHEFAQQYVETDADAENLVHSFKKTFYTQWLNEVYDDLGFDEFNRTKFDRLLSDFRQLDQDQMEIAKTEIQHRVTKRRPKIDLEHASSSEQVFLRREIQKQRRHKPLRELFERTSNLVTRLKPCFMMSPLSVAQYIKRDSIKFDTVIFDEASQVMPQDAISSLIRSDQAIIVGDSKQLPPTRFFKADVEEAENVREDLESILDEATAVLPEKSLLWHYRSNSEELIDFSNHQYYNNRLITFPDTEVTDTAVEFDYVEDGVYDRGGSSQNIPEAEHVADRVEQHVEENGDLSLGVVAFSSAQETAIQEELERRRAENPALDAFMSKEDSLHEFFVKRLEVVQGDERDVMIFSVGYGPDKAGKMSMHFGPLNHDGGERRLNVAVTRAKEKVVVVSSIQPGDIDLSRTNSRGVKHFKKYLEYAKNGEEVLTKDTSADQVLNFDSEFEEAVYTRLEKQGCDVVSQVQSSGYSIDLAIKHPEKPGKFVLGIECDGAAYHNSKTARDRDRLRQQVLEDLGWNIHRIWSPDWTHNQEREVKKIDEKIEEILDEESISPTTVDEEPQTRPVETVNISKIEGMHQSIIDYEEPPKEPQRDRDPEDIKSTRLRNRLKAVVNNWGPIRKEEAYKTVVRYWDIARVGKRLRRKLDREAKTLRRKNKIVADDAYWPAESKLDTIPVRKNSEDDSRSIQEIPILEICKASYIVLSNGFKMERADLILETARLFGFQRTGANVRERIDEAVEFLLKQNLAKEEGDLIYLIEGNIDEAIKQELYR